MGIIMVIYLNDSVKHLGRVNPAIIILKYLYLLPLLSLFCDNYFSNYFLHNFFEETADF